MSQTKTQPGARRVRPGRCARGFTLIEMVVATILLAIGVVAALQCMAASSRTCGVANEYATAALLAQQHLAEVEAQADTLTGGEQQGEFGDAYPGFTWRQAVEPTDLPAVVRLTLTIEWPSGSARRMSQFTTYENTAAAASAAGTPTGEQP